MKITVSSYGCPIVRLKFKKRIRLQLGFCRKAELKRNTQCSSRQVPSEIIGSIVKVFPALATPTALLS
jgi:hypothetical protein